jgi:UDP-N-acetylmuramyl pentapeptide phosphotransferase/UDP-N-acetylglucosamine-1-phosphate transferase
MMMVMMVVLVVVMVVVMAMVMVMRTMKNFVLDLHLHPHHERVLWHRSAACLACASCLAIAF